MLGSLFRYHVVWCKVGVFLSGLIFGHSIVEHGVVSIMIYYVEDQWENLTLRTSVIIVNAQDGLTSILIIFTAYITDAFIGRFNAILYTTLAFILGLVLLWFANPTSNVGLYMVMVVLIAVGQAGREPPLRAFLADHVRRNNNSIDSDYDRVEARSRIWWGVPHFVGAALAIFALGNLSWNKTFVVSTIVMVVSWLLFLSGSRYYHHENVTGSIVTTVYRVFKNAYIRGSIVYSYQPSDYYKNDGGDKLPLMPQLFLLSRWLDKAAIIGEISTLSAEEEEARGRLCTVTQVKEVKTLLKMVPMWATFFMYCLVIATGNTLFIEQITNLNDHGIGIGTNNSRLLIQLLYFFQRMTNHVSSFLCNLLINHKRFKKNKLVAMKLRIGIGLACSCLCCIVARLVEIKRLDKVTKGEFIDQENEIIGMSVFWLVPQFWLLGLTQGLTEDGLLQFFYYQVAESMKEYGPPFNEFVLGIGKLISIFWVLTFKSWIGDDINVSHLENYYGIIAIFSIANLFFIYGSVSKNFYKHAKGEDATLADYVEQLVGELQLEEQIQSK